MDYAVAKKRPSPSTVCAQPHLRFPGGYPALPHPTKSFPLMLLLLGRDDGRAHIPKAPGPNSTGTHEFVSVSQENIPWAIPALLFSQGCNPIPGNRFRPFHPTKISGPAL